MSLHQHLTKFYLEVHKCVKGKGRSKLAWVIINRAIESTQDGGTFFVVDPGNSVVDEIRLATVLEEFDMDYVEIEKPFVGLCE